MTSVLLPTGLDKNLDFEWLLKIRTVVARIGEMDLAKWWNSNGQLGPQGAFVLRRGLPRTHYFAQTRSVCMVADARCAQIFDPPGSVTLWRLTDAIDERLDVLWEGWLDDASSWHPFFERVAGLKSTDVSLSLKEFGLVTDEEIAARRSLKKAADGRSIQIPELFDGGRQTIAMLALGFAAGSPGNLVIPYARRANA
ncbi:BrxE family protein [Pseudorhodoplanes sp.]|uniref:BrxE family protein n=1 Tax=Pseudorhodoplanes sp. TaxID=1934341 RepID=UPI003D0E8C50